MIGPSRKGAVGFLGLWLLVASLPVLAASRIEREFELGSGGEFILDTARGSVSIVGSSGSTARVVITSKRDDIESLYTLEYDETPGRVAVKVNKKGSRLTSWFNWGSGTDLRFEIEVPHETRIDIDTAGGSIEAEGTRGDARLDTSGGSIRATSIEGNVLADTSGGSISVEDIDGDVNADTSGGSIQVEKVRGKVIADTSGGSIHVDDVTGDVNADTSGGSIRISEAGGRVVADTSGGSISVSFLPGNSNGGELSTSGGGIRVSLDPSANLEIDASASGGSVVTDVPVTVRGKASKTALRGTLGSGGARLELSASGGRISIEPL